MDKTPANVKYFFVSRLLKEFSSKQEKKRTEHERLFAKVWNNRFNSTHCSKQSVVLRYFQFYQVEWRRCKVEVTLFMPAW